MDGAKKIGLAETPGPPSSLAAQAMCDLGAAYRLLDSACSLAPYGRDAVMGLVGLLYHQGLYAKIRNAVQVYGQLVGFSEQERRHIQDMMAGRSVASRGGDLLA